MTSDKRKYIKNAIKLIKENDIVSFDMFDTLVHRAVNDPKDIFELATNYKNFKIFISSNSIYVNIAKLRIAAEINSREKSYETTNSREITFFEIFLEMSRQMKNEDVIQAYKKTEILTELRFIYGSEVNKKLFNIAQKLGKQIIIATDMYLDASIIETILEANGYKKPYSLYISGFTCLPKYDGEYFSFVQKNLLTKEMNLVHIGDDEISDKQVPVKYGFNSLLYKKFNSINNYPQTDIASSLATGISNYVLEKNNNLYNKSAERLGLTVFGPLFFGFILWISKCLRHNKSEAVLLALRDMHFFHEILEKYKSKLSIFQDLIPFHVSRLAVAKPAMFAYDDHYLKSFYSRQNKRTIRELLEALGIDYGTKKELIEYCGINNSEEFVEIYDRRLLIFMSLLLPEIQGSCVSTVQPLLSYIDSISSDYCKLSYVDVGYSGTIPVYLFRLLNLLRPSKKFSSMMLAKSNYPHPNFETKSFLSHVPQEYFDDGFCEILEFILTSNQRSTVGYELNEGGAPILLMSENKSDHAAELSNKIKFGASLFIDTAFCLLDGYDLDELVLEGWASNLLFFLKNPTLSEVKIFSDIVHDADVIDRSVRPLIAKSIDDSLESIQKAYDKSFWKSGFKTLNGI